MMPDITSQNLSFSKQADWELDFYSRPILEPDGKKRWELLITTTQGFTGTDSFRWQKICPSTEVNSVWLSTALKEALNDAKNQGWVAPLRIRCWRTSMRTMIKRAAANLNLEVIASRRTYGLIEWLAEREREVYPSEEGYMNGPLAPTPSRILNQPIPLPESVRGDAWSFASLSVGMLREANEWPIEFSGLLPIKHIDDKNLPVPGLRLFSKNRALALAGWLGGLEPVKLVVEGTQLLLEAGQEDRWLVTDLSEDVAKAASQSLRDSIKNSQGLQFISVQTTPEEELFKGFWMLRDLQDNL